MGMGDFLGMRYVLWDDKPAVPAEVLKTFQRIWTRAMLGGPGR
jgi:hypothetical protein